MSQWKKFIFSLLGIFIGIPLVCSFLGGLILALLIDVDDLCQTTIVDEISSPSGKQKAVIYQFDCGATTGFNSKVAIIPTDSTLDKEFEKWFGVDRVFVADGNIKVPRSPGGGPEVRIRWVSDMQMEIQYHYLTHVISKDSSSKGVDIEYRTFGGE